MLDANQKAVVTAALHAASAQNHVGVEQAKARQALFTEYKDARTSLLKTITKQQATKLLDLEKSTYFKKQALLTSKTLSRTEKATKIQSLFTDYLRQRDTIYTPEQLIAIQKLEAMQQRAQTMK